MSSPHDFPADEELGLDRYDLDREEREGALRLRCGCLVYASDLTHDVDDCCEAQADALAEQEKTR